MDPTSVLVCLLMLSMFSSDICKSENDHVAKEVLVIGGGIAGLAAARKLTNHPSQKYEVTVLEAQKDRYGGRVWTSRKLFKDPIGAETDLGASWINTKVEDNPISAIVRKGELETKMSGPVQLHVPDAGKVFTGDDVNKIFTEVFSIMQAAVDTVNAAGKDVPFQKAVEDEISRHTFHGDKDIIMNIIHGHHAVTKGDYSAMYFEPLKQFGWKTIMVDGYDHVLDAIVSGLGTESPLSIELNHVVRQIQVDQKKKKVIVRTKDLKQVTADLVIVAVPMAVLKNEAILFEPALPRAWYQAVKELGELKSNKVIVGFAESFWPADIGVFTMTTAKGEEPGILQTWFNMQNLVGRPYLIGTIYGNAAVEMEKMPVEELKLKVIKVLGKMFGDDVVSQHNVTTLVRSQWQDDAFSLGAGAYPRAGNTPDMWNILSKPVCPYIYFAGEYTSLDGMLGAHGAYNTGVKAAEQIINGYCDRELKRQQKRKEKETEGKKEDSKNKDEL